MGREGIESLSLASWFERHRVAHLEGSVPVTQLRPRKETLSLPEPKYIIDHHYSMLTFRSDLLIRSLEQDTYGIDFIETTSRSDSTFGFVSARGRDGVGYIRL